MVDNLSQAATVLSPEQLWVNPDCGLKTRGWDETVPALENMVAAAHALRERFSNAPSPAEAPTPAGVSG